ncbi:hypothetical protein [Paludibacter sp.]|uniref:hypothetical protein n=1 Tax=Paludibacter sp. TaxID=1898105 RepID=UPI001352E18E|nr:hypothetical protein [Paludibacter sp.]MTK53303.1 hypothetical protein [Paludibacter sp.]
MARTIKEIKADLTTQFMANSTLAAVYGFTVGDSFDAAFSKVSFESIWLYICAYCAYVIEVLFDTHKEEIDNIIVQLKPGGRTWHEGMAKGFMFGYSLVTDEDYYDITGLTDAQITAAHVVKYSAAVEKKGVVYIKVAGEDTSGNRQPITAAQQTAFEAYMKEIKYAGVVIEVVNSDPQYFRLSMTLYYDPMVLDANGMNLSDGTYPVTDAIKSFISNLKFNGEYRNASLVDTLQEIAGVVIPELHLSELSSDGVTWTPVDAKATPDSGYCKVYADADLNITYTAYQSISV